MNRRIFENARFTPKGDIEANWKKATGFVPLDKEIIIYKPDEEHTSARMKIGDGKTGINDLPFMVPEIEIPEQAQVDWTQNDENSVDYVKNRTHWVEQIENYILWEGVLSEDAPEYEGIQFYKISDEIINPLNYIVTIAGTEYTVNSIETTNDIIFGKDEDGTLLVMAGTSEALSQVDVGIAWTEGTYIVNEVSFVYGEAISIKIPSHEIVHKLDNKYIDFDFNFKTDWNQMDPANKGYIKNRTHYVSDQAFEWSGTVGVDGYIEKTGSIRYPTYTWYCAISNIPYDLMGATVSGVRRTPSGEHPFSGVIDQVSKVEGKKQYTSSQCTLPFPIRSSAGGITTSLITRHGTMEYDRGSTMTISLPEPIYKLDSKYLDETTVAFKTDIETVNTELETVKTDVEAIKTEIEEGTQSQPYAQLPVTGVWSSEDSTYYVTLPGVEEITTGLSFIMVPDTAGYSLANLSVNGTKAVIHYAASLLDEMPSASLASGNTLSCYTLSAGVPYKVTYNGTAWIIENNQTSAKNISGVLSVAQGGTGLANITKYGVLAGRSDISGYTQILPKSGAFYATTFGMPQFGILPIPQGGTGATTPREAFNNIASEGGTIGGIIGDNLYIRGAVSEGKVSEFTRPVQRTLTAIDKDTFEISFEDYHGDTSLGNSGPWPGHFNKNTIFVDNQTKKIYHVEYTLIVDENLYTYGAVVSPANLIVGQTYDFTVYIEGTGAIGPFSHSEGEETVALGLDSHAEGAYTRVAETADAGHAEGIGTVAEGPYAHAEGLWRLHEGASPEVTEADIKRRTIARGMGAHAEGEGTWAIGNSAHSEGIETTAGGYKTNDAGETVPTGACHAEGYKSEALGEYSHAEGHGTKVAVIATAGHAEGDRCEANNYASHAEGGNTIANGPYAHVEGYQTISGNAAQHVQGRWNSIEGIENYIHVVGGGTSEEDRRNIHTIDWDGNAWYAGTIKVGGTSYDDASEVALKTNFMTLYRHTVTFGNQSVSLRLEFSSDKDVLFSTFEELLDLIATAQEKGLFWSTSGYVNYVDIEYCSAITDIEVDIEAGTLKLRTPYSLDEFKVLTSWDGYAVRCTRQPYLVLA